MWKKHVHFNHLLKMVNNFEQERGHELGVKETQKKKRDPRINNLNVDEETNL
jgi:hypothetical protein